MGRDLSFTVDGGLEEYVPVASRNNEVLGYIDRDFSKAELKEYIEKMIEETKSYDYNMKDLANAISSLEYILRRVYGENSKVYIRYM